jgi:hypothetical protein
LAVRFYYIGLAVWRVWLVLEPKGILYHRRALSFDAGDVEIPEFDALNPRAAFGPGRRRFRGRWVSQEAFRQQKEGYA